MSDVTLTGAKASRQDFRFYAGKQFIIAVNSPGSTFNSVTDLVWRMVPNPSGSAAGTNGVQKSKTLGGIAIQDDTNCTITIASGDVTEPGLYFHELYQSVAGVLALVCRGRALCMAAPLA